MGTIIGAVLGAIAARLCDGLSVTQWLPLEIPPSATTLRYLATKRNKLGHLLRGV